jgi:hypothetical protein
MWQLGAKSLLISFFFGFWCFGDKKLGKFIKIILLDDLIRFYNGVAKKTTSQPIKTYLVHFRI